jgi:hypothetical protein
MLKQIIEEECIELVRKEVELAENDPVADLSQIMSNVYIDNSKRTHGLRQTSSAANSTMRAREPQARSIDRSASGYTTLFIILYHSYYSRTSLLKQKYHHFDIGIVLKGLDWISEIFYLSFMFRKKDR